MILDTIGGPVIRGLFICVIRIEKNGLNDNFLVKIDVLSANSRFAVQNDGTYLSRITKGNLQCVSGI